MIDQHILDHNATVIKKTVEALCRNRFSAVAAGGKTEALEHILSLIEPGESVGFGGSQTLGRLEVIESLRQRGQKLFEQQPGMTRDEIITLRRQALSADVFLGSPNAVTRKGELLFVDKIGNRAAGMMFGPRTVIAVAGINKIVDDEAAGYVRIASCAAPVNALRLQLKTPCVETGACGDCTSPDRICNIAVTLRKKPAYTAYHVILLPEELGY